MNVYGRICIFGLLSVVLLVAATVQCSKIHEEMTDDEIANTFHSTRDKMPEYDVVPVRHNLYKRSNQNLRLQFTAHGENIDVYLHPSDGQLMGADTPVWISYRTPEGIIEYRKLRKGIVGTVVSSFVNPKDLSTVTVHKPNGEHPSFNGVFNAYSLRSLPERFRKEVRFQRHSEAFNASRTMMDTHYHVVIKSGSVTEEEKIKGLEREFGKASRSGDSADTYRVKRTDQDIIYPSLLVQTDYKGTSAWLYDEQYADKIIYQAAFWNAIDMRYRSVDNPKIRLRIVGIIIATERAAVPYLQNHRSGNVINMTPASEESNSFWYKMRQHKDFPHAAYDIVVTLTDSDLSYQGEMLLGLATQSTSCVQPRQNIFYATATVRDRGGYDGVLPAAHELGHIFGLYHDAPSDRLCGNGFIMAPKTKVSLNNLKWSSCSLRTLSYFMRKSTIDCYDKPTEFYAPGDRVKRLLPGDISDANAQCRARGYAGACDPSPDFCKIMECTHSKPFVRGSVCTKVGPPAEGTRCAPGHKCLDGVCQCMTPDCLYINP